MAARTKLATLEAANVNIRAPADYGCLNTKHGYNGICIVTGAIVIPFRAEFTGKHDTYAGVSGDLFVGVNFSPFSDSSFSITPLLYIGYLPTFSSGTANQTSTGSTAAGALDFGAGIAIPVHTGFDSSAKTTPHIGFVVGADTTGSAKFTYGGRPYGSVVFGLNF